MKRFEYIGRTYTVSPIHHVPPFTFEVTGYNAQTDRMRVRVIQRGRSQYQTLSLSLFESARKAGKVIDS